MGAAMAEMLPYVIGLLVSPVPIAAVAVLSRAREGMRKGIVFCFTWWLVCFVVVLVLSLAARIPSRMPGVISAWDSSIKIFLGLVLLLSAVRHFIEMRGGPRHSPQDLAGLGELHPDRLAVASARLLLASPLRLSVMIAAALELGSRELTTISDLVPSLLFASIATLTVILPLLIRVSARCLLRYNDLLLFLTSLCFGAVLLVSGLRLL